MKNYGPLILTIAALVFVMCGTEPKTPFQTNHDWTEPDDPAAAGIGEWVDAGDHISFGTIDEKYPRSVPFTGPQSREATLTGWRGEKVSAQFVIWTAGGLDGLECSVSGFKAPDGTTLDGIATTRFVKYVLSDNFNPASRCGLRPMDGFPTILEPDLLSEEPSLDVPANTSRPVWVTVEIPRDAPKGTYTAEINARAGNGFRESLKLKLEVIDRTLPYPAEWEYHLDLWQHPSSVAFIENVGMWSDEHFALMEPVMKMLADAGQKVVTVNLNKDPWNVQTQFPYEDMIVWTKRKDGNWEYDFTVFDRWVTFMFGLGIDKYINCFSLLPWNNELHYRDEETGQTITVEAIPGTDVFRDMWTPFLEAFTAHLRQTGWLDKVNIAMDERPMDQMEEATALLSEVAPELGIAFQDNHFIFRKYPYIRDMCVGIFEDVEPNEIAGRRDQGLLTTYYVCCSSGFPNTFTSSEPAEAVYFAWFAAARDYDGFLRWSYNSWTEDPIRDSRFRRWTAGDTYIVYPEARSSIRFERLIEGVQDWEKIRILRASVTDDGGLEKLARLEAALRDFSSRDRLEGWNQRLNEAKRLLNDI